MDIATDQTKAKAARPRAVKQQAATEASEIEKLANVPLPVKAFGREYGVKRLTLGQIAQSLAYVGTLQTVIKQVADEYDKRGSLSNAQIGAIAVGSLANSTYSMIGLLSVVTTEPIEWLEEQDDIIGATDLLTAAIEKNAPLFSKNNLAHLKANMGRIQEAIPALSGLTSTA